MCVIVLIDILLRVNINDIIKQETESQELMKNVCRYKTLRIKSYNLKLKIFKILTYISPVTSRKLIRP